MRSSSSFSCLPLLVPLLLVLLVALRAGERERDRDCVEVRREVDCFDGVDSDRVCFFNFGTMAAGLSLLVESFALKSAACLPRITDISKVTSTLLQNVIIVGER